MDVYHDTHPSSDPCLLVHVGIDPCLLVLVHVGTDLQVPVNVAYVGEKRGRAR
jgi:hypothetical protein